MPSKTLGRDMEDRWGLDRVSDVESWWKFNRSFWRMIPIIWHHLHVHQEPACPPRLQEKTWRTGGILTGFLMSNLDETLAKASEGWYLSSETTSRFIRNLHVLQDSRNRLGGQVESWQGSWCPIKMKLSQNSIIVDVRMFVRTFGCLYITLFVRGFVAFRQGYWSWILMKISQKYQKDTPSYLPPFPGSSGISMSS